MTQEIGDYIALLRKKKGYTQVHLGDIIGVSDKTVSKWERNEGMPEVSILPDLALALDTSVDSLLNGSPVKVWRLIKGLGSQDDIAMALYAVLLGTNMILVYTTFKLYLVFVLTTYQTYDIGLMLGIVLLNALNLFINKYFSRLIQAKDNAITYFFDNLLKVGFVFFSLVMADIFIAAIFDYPSNGTVGIMIWLIYTIVVFTKMIRQSHQ